MSQGLSFHDKNNSLVALTALEQTFPEGHQTLGHFSCIANKSSIIEVSLNFCCTKSRKPWSLDLHTIMKFLLVLLYLVRQHMCIECLLCAKGLGLRTVNTFLFPSKAALSVSRLQVLFKPSISGQVWKYRFLTYLGQTWGLSNFSSNLFWRKPWFVSVISLPAAVLWRFLVCRELFI